MEAKGRPTSAFGEMGLQSTIESTLKEIAALYLEDGTPWVVGYSGGKDSTAVLQLVWLALERVPPEQRSKKVHVISTDTLVENPIVAAWVNRSLDTMKRAATEKGIPIDPNRLTPDTADTFWVNLIGRGYPSPRHKFRWCTERLKIRPSNRFITNVVHESGEAILLLGTRRAESARRAQNMDSYARKRLRDKLSPNGSLPNCLVYTPIENWTNDDVWMFLMQVENPWGYRNKDLLTMYQGASPDGECPLVVDTSTPSCGDSRFGCWVCTLVDQDKSMTAMIQNDEEKEWMLPLLELRNELDVADDRPLRDFRRMTGVVQLFHDRPIHGPYTQESRGNWLRKLLKAQYWIRQNGPSDMRDLELITIHELNEIRRIWVVEKHEIEDLLPGIYESELGESFPGLPMDDGPAISADDLKLLAETCGADRLRYELARDLLDVERRFRGMARRVGLFDAIEDTIRRCFYEGEQDATGRMLREKEAQNAASDGRYKQLAWSDWVRKE